MEMNTSLSFQQLIPLYIAGLFILLSLFFFWQKNHKLSVLLMIAASLGLGVFISMLDSFLVLWDEQFHALVAKHMMKHPFKPMLYKDIFFEHDFKNWTVNHIWLHKPPLFLWQMALSMKVWGLDVLAVRFPSILMHAFLTFMVYRIGKIAVGHDYGYWGALFFTVAYYPLEMVAGRFATDHNDVAILFYITASFWSYFEYKNSGNKIWIVLIGLFAGCAVLVKWLIGLLIYPCWATTAIDLKKRSIRREVILRVIQAFAVSLLVFMPWYIYILLVFPEAARFELLHHLLHLSEPIEAHSGGFFYHLNAMHDLYGGGQAVPYILFLGVIVLLIKIRDRESRIILGSSVVVVYLVFGLAATKMKSFTLIVSPVFFWGVAALLVSFSGLMKKYLLKSGFLNKVATTIIALGISWMLFDYHNIERRHTMKEPHNNLCRIFELAKMEMIQRIDSCSLDPDKVLIFNAPEFTHVPIMFHTNFTAYNHNLSNTKLKRVRELNKMALVLKTNESPHYLEGERNVLILDVSDLPLRRCN